MQEIISSSSVLIHLFTSKKITWINCALSVKAFTLTGERTSLTPWSAVNIHQPTITFKSV